MKRSHNRLHYVILIELPNIKTATSYGKWQVVLDRKARHGRRYLYASKQYVIPFWLKTPDLQLALLCGGELAGANSANEQSCPSEDKVNALKLHDAIDVDREIRGPIAIDIAIDIGLRPGIDVAQFADLLRKRVSPNEIEGLTAIDGSVGVDPAKIDDIAVSLRKLVDVITAAGN